MTHSTAAEAEKVNGQQPRPGHEGQTFLVGADVYLRGMEVSDGKYVTSWRDSLFPVSTERGEEIIKDELPKQAAQRKNMLAIVRKADDRVVGSVSSQSWASAVFLTVHVDPALGEAGAKLKADALTTVAPWVIEELQRAIVFVELGAHEKTVIAAAKGIGMRESARFREALLRNGQRVDLLLFELPSPAWVKTLGDPADVALERTGTGEPRPVPAKVTVDGDPPPHAFMVAKRVYLRPLQKEDAEREAQYSRQETEIFWDNGRFARSPVVLQHFQAEMQKESIPSDYFFAVCLRENDEYIGSVGVIDLDLINGYAETGSEIQRPEYRGGGYGSEAKQLLLEYCFDRLGLHMVRSFVIFPNTRSAAALRKQGYSEAGRFHWAFPVAGGFGNIVVFDLLASEWRALPRAE
jgi:RimJ/RimL family protein N-acetyltransferase